MSARSHVTDSIEPLPEAGDARSQRFVLVVDDRADVRVSLGRVLEFAGFSVQAVASPEAAREACARQTFGFLILDWRFPASTLSGTDLLRQLRDDGVDTPCLLLSAYASAKIRLATFPLGNVVVLRKGVGMDEIVAVVRGGMRARRVRTAQLSIGGLRYRSMTHRWADYVMRALDFDGDIKTVEAWAALLRMATSTLSDACDRVNLAPKAACDFLRVLSAVIWANRNRSTPDSILDVRHSSTLARLTDGAGVSLHERPTVAQFLDRQHFIPQDHPALKALKERLQRAGWI
jgi:DNA-binding response OmpR family regulator